MAMPAVFAVGADVGKSFISSPKVPNDFPAYLPESLFLPVPQVLSASAPKRTKVTVVGVGNVGMACAQTMLTQQLLDELALVDVQADKLKGEMMDLQHAAGFLPSVNIVSSTDYSVTAGSDLCVVTAGARQVEGESRLSLVGRNVNLLKKIIPKLVHYSPNTILLIVSNPVDILTWASWKLSGLPVGRVLGSGTNLDSSRFRFLIADALNVNAQSVHAQVLGEHGDSSVPMWSTVSVGGIPLLQVLREQQPPGGVTEAQVADALLAIHQQVVQGAYEVIRLKGYTSWAIGYSVAAFATAILGDQHRIQPLSVLAKGVYGIQEEVFLSLPGVLGREGLLALGKVRMSDVEECQMRESARALWNIQKDLDLRV